METGATIGMVLQGFFVVALVVNFIVFTVHVVKTLYNKRKQRHYDDQTDRRETYYNQSKVDEGKTVSTKEKVYI